MQKVDIFRVEAQMRIENIATELKNVTADDFERGWVDAFDQVLITLIMLIFSSV
jgi:hypothetical protein